jgi:hypothetical protein
VRPPRAEDAALPAFEPPESAPPLRTSVVRPGDSFVVQRKDIGSNRVEVERWNDDGLIRVEDFDWEYGASARRVYAIDPDDPLSAEVKIKWEKEFGRGDMRIFIDAETSMRVTRTQFLLKGRLRTFEGETPAFDRSFECAVPRDQV